MTNVTIQLSDREIKALKARTGRRSPAAALKAWAARANAKWSIVELRIGLKDSLKEEAAKKGRRFSRGRWAIRWLENGSLFAPDRLRAQKRPPIRRKSK